MVSDSQIKQLLKLMERGETLAKVALKTGMDVKTARKYAKAKKLPSTLKAPHTWRTREDVFSDVWEDLRQKLKLLHGIEAKTLFDDLQRRHPGRFQDGQLRTLQRKVKHWRATEGPGKEVYFEQVYTPGERSQSDFTHMNKLGVTIQGEPFDHLVYHFALCYSNWETGTVCFSESFEALSEGLQNALWELGGIPTMHQTDRLTTAVNKDTNPEVFTERYEALMRYYGLEPRRTQAASPNENGDVESLNGHFKKAVEQALLLRGSSDFVSREAYQAFLRTVIEYRNAGRQQRLAEERTALQLLPADRLDSCRPPIKVRVTRNSTIRVQGNAYSVHSRLIGEEVSVRLYVEHLEVWYAQKCIERIPRLRGKQKHRIDYRHIIDWLVRKPGAFANYRYRAELFPTHRFRVAYDLFAKERPGRADKEYLRLLHLAARVNEAAVDDALLYLIAEELPLTVDAVEDLVCSATELPSPKDITIERVDLSRYDALLTGSGDGALTAVPTVEAST
jgi:transposase